MTSSLSKSQRGLTLLEMVVVLLIAAMAITLGFQSLAQWQRARSSISSAGTSATQGILTKYWFLESVRSFTTHSKDALTGNSREISGVALQPLLSKQGSIAPIEWTLLKRNGAWALKYSEQGSELSLPLDDITDASFTYIDGAGAEHSVWPPKLGEHRQLPEAIALRQKSNNGVERLWMTPIVGNKNPLHDERGMADE